jgi:hypothetical protein
MSELWSMHFSVASWHNETSWSDFFDQCQKILGCSLTQLDTRDPPRRKVASLAQAGAYVCAFGAREETRWVFGSFGESAAELTVRHAKHASQVENSVKWTFPAAFEQNAELRGKLVALFRLTSLHFRCFYACADRADALAAKKKSSGAVDLEAELLGVFSLTYLCPAYVRFFGREKLSRLPGSTLVDDAGALVDLSAGLGLATADARQSAAEILGRESFVDTKDMLGKRAGRFALTYEQLRSEATPLG